MGGLFGGGGGGSPSFSPDPVAPAPLNVDEAELARQRQDLEKRRTGRKSLRIDPGTVTTIGSGLRLPE
jgi:hypothetical protein